MGTTVGIKWSGLKVWAEAPERTVWEFQSALRALSTKDFKLSTSGKKEDLKKRLLGYIATRPENAEANWSPKMAPVIVATEFHVPGWLLVVTALLFVFGVCAVTYTVSRWDEVFAWVFARNSVAIQAAPSPVPTLVLKEVVVAKSATEPADVKPVSTVVVPAVMPTTAPTATPMPTMAPTMMPTLDKVDKLSTAVALLGEVVTKQQVTVSGTIMSVAPITSTSWKVTYEKNAPAAMKDWVIQNPNPRLWSVFPNVTVTDTISGRVYPAKDNVEYGMAESIFCQQGKTCDIVVGARHYRLITGDYDIKGIDTCLSDGRTGCALLIINVGESTVVYRQQMVDAGFTVTGRYWNGDKLDQAIWAVMSHAAYNMLNLSNDKTNMGANCGNPEGCKKVRLTFVVVSGSETLMKGTTTVGQ